MKTLLLHPLILAFLLRISAGFEIMMNDHGDNSLPPVNEEDYQRHKNVVCSASPLFSVGAKSSNYSFLDEITESEIFDLAFVNLAYGLTADAITHFQEEMTYKKRVLDLLSLLTKQTCLNDVVPDMYLNAAKNLYLYYVYKRERSPPNLALIPKSQRGVPKNQTVTESVWMELISMLEQCSTHVTPIPIIQTCDFATEVATPSGTRKIAIIEERFDIEVNKDGKDQLDEVIDAVWWMFSTTYARCYTHFYPRDDWVISLFENFRREFLQPFMGRWRSPGLMAEYFPLVFGPFDFKRAKENMRACTAAAYQYEGIAQRQLVRPVMVTVDNINMLNFKVGVSERR